MRLPVLLLALLAGCRSAPTPVEVEPEPVEATVPPAPSTTAVPAPTASATASESVACVLTVAAEGDDAESEPTRFEGGGATHAAACAKAWEAVGRFARVKQVDGVDSDDVVRALRDDAWTAPAEGKKTSTCEVTTEERAGTIEAKGKSTTSGADAQKLAEADLCRQLGPGCKTDELGGRSVSSTTTMLNGTTTYQYTVRYAGRVEETKTQPGRGQRGWAHACREALGDARGKPGITVVTVDGIPFHALRPSISPFFRRP